MSVCASVQLVLRSTENTNMITDVLALISTTFHFILNITASIYDGKICLFSYGSGLEDHSEMSASN